MSLTRRVYAGIAILFALPSASWGLGPATPYVYTPLGYLGFPEGTAINLNESGDVVGVGSVGGFRAFLWTRAAGIQDLGAPSPGDTGGDYSAAYAINASGLIAGQGATPAGLRALVWSAPNVYEDLGDFPGGASYSWARGINDVGQVVGVSGASTGNRAFLWTRSAGMTDLGDLPGGANVSEAFDVNELGQVVGESGAATGARAFLWTEEGGMLDLGDLPGGVNFSSARAINDLGQVVGWSAAAGGDRAFLWTSSGGMQALDLPPGATISRALDINNRGQVVGVSDAGLFLWSASTGHVLLDEHVTAANISLSAVYAINDAGQIVGEAYNSATSYWEPYLLTPVPEPRAWALLTVAGCGMGAARRSGATNHELRSGRRRG